jgi:hypothetical protein
MFREEGPLSRLSMMLEAKKSGSLEAGHRQAI